MTFDQYTRVKILDIMEELTAYGSGEEDDGDDQKTPKIDPKQSVEVLAKLKERFPLDSAPAVPIRVSIN